MGEVSYLIDTHVLLWGLADEKRLSPAARRALRHSGHRIFVSSASGWEIATKHRLGKLELADQLAGDIMGAVRAVGFDELPINLRHAQAAGAWPQAHRDPFDRMIAAQSALEHLPLITSDPALRRFGVEVIW